MLFVTETQYQYKLGKQSELCNLNFSSIISVFGINFHARFHRSVE